LVKACVLSNFLVIQRIAELFTELAEAALQIFVAEFANPCEYGDSYLLLKP